MEDVYVGIDASLTGTGLFAINNKGKVIAQKKLTSDSKTRIEARITDTANDVIAFIINNHGTHYNLEGMFVGKNKQKALQSGGLHYYLRITLEDSGFYPTITPPTQLKKFVTGKGNCKKEIMLLKTYRKWQIEFTDHDLCDAYGLARMIMEENENNKAKQNKPTGFIRRLPLKS